MRKTIILLIFCFVQILNAQSGAFFAVSGTGNIITLSLVKPNSYSNVGLKLPSNDYAIFEPALNGFTLQDSGYYTFFVDGSTDKTISIIGPNGSLAVILCLNGKGPVSCQRYPVNMSSTAFRIVPTLAPLPTKLVNGFPVKAYYLVTNTRGETLTGNTLRYTSSAPQTVIRSINQDPAIPNLCGSPFTLTPNQSCVLELSISGPVEPNNGFYLCSDNGYCAAPNPPLDVSTGVINTLDVTPNPIALFVSQTQVLNVTGTFSSTQGTGNLTGSSLYSSSNPSVATVSSTGLVTALSTGTTLVTASYANYSPAVSVSVSTLVPTYSVGGLLTGLPLGQTISLSDGTDTHYTLSTDGAFTFPTRLNDGTTYAVTVTTQPVNDTCDVTNGTGTISGGDITNVSVNCWPYINTANTTGAQELTVTGTGFISGTGTGGLYSAPSGTPINLAALTRPFTKPHTCVEADLVGFNSIPFNSATSYGSTQFTINNWAPPSSLQVKCVAFCNASTTGSTYSGPSADCSNVVTVSGL